jgi:hypothetical protein
MKTGQLFRMFMWQASGGWALLAFSQIPCFVCLSSEPTTDFCFGCAKTASETQDEPAMGPQLD